MTQITDNLTTAEQEEETFRRILQESLQTSLHPIGTSGTVGAVGPAGKPSDKDAAQAFYVRRARLMEKLESRASWLFCSCFRLFVSFPT